MQTHICLIVLVSIVSHFDATATEGNSTVQDKNEKMHQYKQYIKLKIFYSQKIFTAPLQSMGIQDSIQMAKMHILLQNGHSTANSDRQS